jgi:N-carbamoyl-L-amino-acid hydrolase
VVSSIVGICSYRLAFIGRADHAGTTPMPDRLDAAQGAAAFTLAVRQAVLQDFPECVANVGMLRLLPGAFNIVPRRAKLSLELRSAEPQSYAQLEAALLELTKLEAVHYGLDLEIEFLNRHPPTPLSPLAQQAIVQAADSLGLSHMLLPSGAGHDAQSLAPL